MVTWLIEQNVFFGHHDEGLKKGDCMRREDLPFSEYSKEEVIALLDSVISKAEFVERFTGQRMSRSGHMYRWFNIILEEYEIEYDMKHRANRHNLKKYQEKRYRPAGSYLKNNGPFITTHTLKLKLLKEGIKEYKCESCGNSTWQERKIPLELHHVDGNGSNNRLENLELLCPNCHAQTKTYKVRNA